MCRFSLFRRRIDHFAYINSEMRLQQAGATVHFMAVLRLKVIQLAAHVDVLCSLSRKHEHHCGRLTLAHMGGNSLSLQRANAICRSPADQHSCVIKASASYLQCVGDIGKLRVRMLLEVAEQIRGRALKCRTRFG